METHNEVGNTYNNWTVLSSYESKTSAAAWLCECACGYQRAILGVELRRGKIPLCTNCCRVCGRTRSEVEFKGNKRICHNCYKKRVREWKKNSKKHKGTIANWLKRNPESVEKSRKNERNRIQSSPEIFLRSKYKDLIRKSKRLQKSLDNRNQQKSQCRDRRKITIKEDELIDLWHRQKGLCAISNMPMAHEFKNPCAVSIDRIDSELGYTLNNTQLVCQWVNFAKNSFQDDQIRRVLLEYKATN